MNPFYKEQVPNYASDSIYPSFGKLTFKVVIPELREHGLSPGSTFYGNPFKKHLSDDRKMVGGGCGKEMRPRAGKDEVNCDLASSGRDLISTCADP